MTPNHSSPPRLLSIAGSDSGGGAGIQADLKAFAACGGHGMTAITAITAQNTSAVESVHPVAPEAIVAQVRAVAHDIGIDAVKIGMLGDAATIEAVEAALDLVGDAPIVLDPVMVAESGAVLLDESARYALSERLVPRATVITPNVPEARVLAGTDESVDDGRATEPGDAGVERLARELLSLGPAAVVITGGHRIAAADLYLDAERSEWIRGERHPDGVAHGSGCTHSAALAAHLAHGLDPLEAARRAKAVASEAVRCGLREIGSGAGPVDVMGAVGGPLAAPTEAPLP